MKALEGGRRAVKFPEGGGTAVKAPEGRGTVVKAPCFNGKPKIPENVISPCWHHPPESRVNKRIITC